MQRPRKRRLDDEADDAAPEVEASAAEEHGAAAAPEVDDSVAAETVAVVDLACLCLCL